ncbi:MAG: hypothetical protein ACFB9N_11230 [Geitlerinemataceae cyanobacterium]
MLKKLFGGKKEDFFVNLDDGSSESVKTSKAPAEAPAAEAPAAKAAAEVAAAEAPAAKVESAAPEATAAEAPAPEAPAEAPAAEAEPEPEPGPTNFATTYLKPSGRGISRRRPSANMDGFLDMARDVRR